MNLSKKIIIKNMKKNLNLKLTFETYVGPNSERLCVFRNDRFRVMCVKKIEKMWLKKNAKNLATQSKQKNRKLIKKNL